MDLRFRYALNKDTFRHNPKNKTSSYSYGSLLCLQQLYPSTQVGFKAKVSVSSIEDLQSFNKEKFDIEQGYLIIKNQLLGSVEYGKSNLLSYRMLINTSKIYTGSGGINGDWVDYANLRGGNNRATNCAPNKINNPKKCDGGDYDKDDVFWIKPNIYSNYNGLKSEFEQPVVSYISPRIYNFQLGLSYMPGKSNIGYSKLIGGGISYENSISDDISFTTAITGEFAQPDSITVSNPEGEDTSIQLNQLIHWNAGLNLKYFNLNCILSYGNGGKSGRVMIPAVTSTYYTNMGIVYHSESRKVSLTYFQSGRDIENLGTNELTSYATSIEYPLLPNTSYYFDLVYFNTEEPKVTNNNTGYAFLAGLKLGF